MDHTLALRVGELLGRAGTPDPVDGSVAVLAAETGAEVLTSDPANIQHLLNHLGHSGKRAVVASLR